MTTKIIEFPLEDGGYVRAEINQLPTEALEGIASMNPTVERTHTTFEQATQNIRPIADSLLASLTSLDVSPDEVTIDFGVRFTGDAGVILASVSTQASCTVRLTWRKK
ncbi:MAG: hypothetical protein KTR25_19995 [Myxococcales bacterium]|nr:hypothetical protein [Myxococcales bacterium]